MTIVDANLLIYAYSSGSPKHRAARQWWEDTLNGDDAVGIPWICVIAFLRILTNQRLNTGVKLADAIAAVDSWIAHPGVVVIGPAANHWVYLRRLLLQGKAVGVLGSDAHLAALTMEHGGTLYTHDRGFSRFAGLRWIDPLG